MKKFEVGQSYYTRAFSNYDCIYKETIVARTAKTIKTESGKTFRVTDKCMPGIEYFSFSGNLIRATDIWSENLLDR